MFHGISGDVLTGIRYRDLQSSTVDCKAMNKPSIRKSTKKSVYDEPNDTGQARAKVIPDPLLLSPPPILGLFAHRTARIFAEQKAEPAEIQQLKGTPFARAAGAQR
ncbi:hypothetical protein WN982_28670 [Paraburkholderia sp. IMGN_8]|uniref:hypothetical protein n=1 Tax=Paraburkholderia sp. IMGN_8 TaxID=3136564 RepID=UPI003100C6B9